MNSLNNELQAQADIKILFDKYYSRLVHFSYQMVSDLDAAEDIVQDLFIKYWNQQGNISIEETCVKSYLYSGVRNASLNLVRHSRVAEKYMNEQDPFPVEEEILHSIIRSEVLAELHQAINLLPAACREISLKGYLEGMKNHEIALELGISINTVKTQKQRALKLLRLKLSPEMFALALLYVLV